MENCVFCRDFGEKDFNFIFSFQHWVLLHETNPMTNYHCILVIKKHFENLEEIPNKMIKEFGEVLKKAVMAIKKVDNEIKTVSIVSLNYNTKHIHFHLIPIFYNEKIRKIGNPEINGSGITYLSHKEVVQDTLEDYLKNIYSDNYEQIANLMNTLLKDKIKENSKNLRNILQKL